MSSKPSRYVYVISAPNGLVKVGGSACVYERFTGHQGCSPLILRLAYVCECRDAAKIEKAAHDALGLWRRHRDWFEVSPDRAIAVIREALANSGQTPVKAPDRVRKAGPPISLVSDILETAL